MPEGVQDGRLKKWLNTPEGTLWGNLLFKKEPMPVGPRLGLRQSYMLALMWEMEVRKIKEKLAFANMLRETALLIKSEGKIPQGALEDYIGAVAPFVKKAEDEERKKIFEALERETQQPLRISPVRMPSRRIVSFKRGKGRS